MLAYIPDSEPHQWLYKLVREYPRRTGKAIRPALCLSSCRAFGGDDEPIFPVAVVIELLHNAFLIHDDIADGSERRRGRPTLAAQHGEELALNAGDALAVLANQVLRQEVRRLPSQTADRVLDEFDTMALQTLAGQATELGWRRDRVVDLTPEDYLNLIMQKTCWYTTIHPLRVAKIVACGPSADLGGMVRFGFYLGAAFQIRDDLLNLTGDEAAYGKEIDGDLFEGKRTLPLIHLFSQATGGAARTVKQYVEMDRSQRSPEVVAEIRGLLDEYGSIEFATEYASGIAGAAVEAYEEAFGPALPGPDAEFVRALIPYMLGRST